MRLGLSRYARAGGLRPPFHALSGPPRGGASFAARARRRRRRSPRGARFASGPLWGRGGWLRPSPPRLRWAAAACGAPLGGPFAVPGPPCARSPPLRGWGGSLRSVRPCPGVAGFRRLLPAAGVRGRRVALRAPLYGFRRPRAPLPPSVPLRAVSCPRVFTHGQDKTRCKAT